jgi:hypothetical protein
MGALAESSPTFLEYPPSMGFTNCKGVAVEGSYYAYSSIVGGKLCLLIGLRTLPLLRSRHNIPSIF